MTEKEKMVNGMLYNASDTELFEGRKSCKKKIYTFNTMNPDEDDEKRFSVIKDIFGKTGERVWVETPFHCDYGWNITVGEDFYANYNLTILDVAPVTIGKNVMCAPNVAIYTAGHPIDPDVRNSGLEYGKPITIGDNVWIGGNTVILPGVTIGNNVVIGAGSVVTKDIPDNAVACGNPCRVMRSISDEDKKIK